MIRHSSGFRALHDTALAALAEDHMAPLLNRSSVVELAAATSRSKTARLQAKSS
jgi:hypothetical protein